MSSSPAGVDRPSLPLRWAFIVFVALTLTGAAVYLMAMRHDPWQTMALVAPVLFVAIMKFLDWLIA